MEKIFLHLLHYILLCSYYTSAEFVFEALTWLYAGLEFLKSADKCFNCFYIWDQDKGDFNPVCSGKYYVSL